MIRAGSALPAGHWLDSPADRIALAFDDRNRRRVVMQAEGGLAFLLDLPKATALRHGDGLLLEDGRVVEVRAAPEALLQVQARDAHHLARLAWHIGNRHVPAAIEPQRILIRPDHVIAAMLAGLGAEVSALEAPFDPERGAYDARIGSARGHDSSPHDHHHDHD